MTGGKLQKKKRWMHSRHAAVASRECFFTELSTAAFSKQAKDPGKNKNNHTREGIY